MPDPTPEVILSEDELPEASGAPEPVYCRHCGEAIPSDDPDQLCDGCGRLQDAMICPTCHQIARVSLMPAELVPTPHAPKRSKAKTKE